MHRGVSSIFFIHDKPIIGKRVEEPFQISSKSIFCTQRFSESTIKYSFQKKRWIRTFLIWAEWGAISFAHRNFPCLTIHLVAIYILRFAIVVKQITAKVEVEPWSRSHLVNVKMVSPLKEAIYTQKDSNPGNWQNVEQFHLGLILLIFSMMMTLPQMQVTIIKNINQWFQEVFF